MLMPSKTSRTYRKQGSRNFETMNLFSNFRIAWRIRVIIFYFNDFLIHPASFNQRIEHVKNEELNDGSVEGILHVPTTRR